MQQCFNLYSKDIALSIANSIVENEKEIAYSKNKS